MRCLCLLQIDPAIAEIIEEPPTSYWFDAMGRHRGFRFDFITVGQDKRRTAVAALLADRAVWPKANLTFIAKWDQKFTDIGVDNFRFMTEDRLSIADVWNADLIRSAREDKDMAPRDKLREIIATLNGSTTVARLVAASGHQGQAFRAIARLIGDKELLIVEGDRIDYPMQVRRPRV
jgi:hypothetical protein